ncbi:MAG: hypothetical protein NTAFB05_25180 [Nitrobacter sp.]|uniref:energy transducer TonB n=1 Tax=Nitrobacter sp. TaxID=29420 RepID=UPI00387DE761
MPAAIAHGGLIRRGVARTGGIAVVLIGHLAVLSALGYQRAGEPILGELPTVIAVDIVSAPAPLAAMTYRRPSMTDDDSPRNAGSIDRLQTAAVEQRDEPPAAPPMAAAAATAVTTVASAKRASSTPQAFARRISPAKRRDTPLAIAPASNRPAATDLHDGGATGTTGVSARPSNVPSAWKNKLLSHLDRYKRYPDAARAHRREGTALLSFGMNRDGRVLTYHLVRSSGCPELDDEVLAMIERASPLPPAPPELNAQIVQLVVPVRFRM